MPSDGSGHCCPHKDRDFLLYGEHWHMVSPTGIGPHVPHELAQDSKLKREAWDGLLKRLTTALSDPN